jgi:hypothetical protein
MRIIFQLYKSLSLDIAFGAVGMMWFVGQLLESNFSANYYLLMFLSVWIIYTSDHLLDAEHIKNEAISHRHRLHQRYSGILLLLVFVAIGCALAILPAGFIDFIRSKAIFFIALVLSYFIGINLFYQYFKFIKEIFASLLYAGGIVLVPFHFMQQPVTALALVIFIAIFLLALSNLLLFSLLDYEDDLANKQKNISHIIGKIPTKKLIYRLNTISILFSVGSMCALKEPKLSFYALLALILSVIAIRVTQCKSPDNTKLLADGIFLLPYLLIPFFQLN